MHKHKHIYIHAQMKEAASLVLIHELDIIKLLVCYTMA